MRIVATLLMFAGYSLIYASVAAGGVFATEPWAGMFSDAYISTGANLGVAGAVGTDITNLGNVVGNAIDNIANAPARSPRPR